MAKKKAAVEAGPIQKVAEAVKGAAGEVVAATQNVLTNMGLRREKRVARRKTRRAKVAKALGLTPAPAKKAAPKKAAPKKGAAKKTAAKPAKKKSAKKAAKKK